MLVKEATGRPVLIMVEIFYIHHYPFTLEDLIPPVGDDVYHNHVWFADNKIYSILCIIKTKISYRHCWLSYHMWLLIWNTSHIHLNYALFLPNILSTTLMHLYKKFNNAMQRTFHNGAGCFTRYAFILFCGCRWPKNVRGHLFNILMWTIKNTV